MNDQEEILNLKTLNNPYIKFIQKFKNQKTIWD